MKKEFLSAIKVDIESRVKGEVYVFFEGDKVYITIIPPIWLFWCRMYTKEDLAGLDSHQVGRLVKDDYEKFIISQYFTVDKIRKM